VAAAAVVVVVVVATAMAHTSMLSRVCLLATWAGAALVKA
jgi:hypothetical protein